MSESNSDYEELDYSTWDAPKSNVSLNELLNKEKSSQEIDISEEDLKSIEASFNSQILFEKQEIKNHGKVDQIKETSIKSNKIEVLDESTKQNDANETNELRDQIKHNEHIEHNEHNEQSKQWINDASSEHSSVSKETQELFEKLQSLRKFGEADPNQDFEIEDSSIESILKIHHLPFDRATPMNNEFNPLDVTSQIKNQHFHNQILKQPSNLHSKKRISIADLGIESDTDSSEDEKLSFDDWKKKHESKRKESLNQKTRKPQKAQDLFSGLVDSFQSMENDKSRKYVPNFTPEEHEKFLKWMFPLCK